MNKKFKIACFGYLEKDAGSLAGANFLVVEELLNRGYQIDFYGRKDFVYPQQLFRFQNFNYIHVNYSILTSILLKLPYPLNKIITVTNLLFSFLDTDLIKKNIEKNHEVKLYDLLLILGCYSKFKIKSLPTVNWLQGPPQTEQFYNLNKLKKEIITISGFGSYIKLKLFYVIKNMFAMPKVEMHDILICGSQWSKQQITKYGFDSKSIYILPYPININFFTVNNTINKTNDYTTFLWLGRCDPRKRLDLLMEAFELVLMERQDVKLKIYGAFRYAKGYKKLINNFKFSEFVEYQDRISRKEVLNQISQCDILVQPSEGENFGSSVAEALCCGLPVIVGSTNGTKDYISAFSFVFPDYNPESLKTTMLKAIQVIEKDKEILALDARKTAENNFNVCNIIDDFEKILADVLITPQLIHK